MKIEIYCRCGGGLKGETSSNAIAALLRAWLSVHNRHGCGECDEATARKAERKAESKRR